MIGVIANPADGDVVAEFFELFKTPWEAYEPGKNYDVVLDAIGGGGERAGRLIVRYGSRRISADGPLGVCEHSAQHDGRLLQGEDSVPLYGRWATFPDPPNDHQAGTSVPCDAGIPIGYARRTGESTELRLGYDLFAEIRTLLTQGQPEGRAGIPTLELHIELLRCWMTRCGVPAREIRPAPEGYRFVAALTHDVDHPSLRRHRLDHTVLGFLARATFGSAREWLRGRKSGWEMLQNWGAALRLPFVQLGFARDFWLDFVRYPELEGRPSTFFVIPFAGEPGRAEAGRAPWRRASAYAAADITVQLQALRRSGCEIGLHGLDAWCDVGAAVRERDAAGDAATVNPKGVRMHWLYFDERAPNRLERAGFDYDSTFGYNGAVGFRAGTAQVFRPLNCQRLLELPLIVMDTALFYPSHLDLSRSDASRRVAGILDNTARFGGCLTVNWHDRSVSSERQWGGAYRDLLREIEQRGAWITTAEQAVDWFRRRRGTKPSACAGWSDRLALRCVNHSGASGVADEVRAGDAE